MEVKMSRKTVTWLGFTIASVLVVLSVSFVIAGVTPDGETSPPCTMTVQGPRNVIFIHPDGAAQSHFTAARLLHYGPDGRLAWDELPHVAITTVHVRDNLQAGSVGGAVAHSTGIKSYFGVFGFCPVTGQPLTTLMEEAQGEGFAIGLINFRYDY